MFFEKKRDVDIQELKRAIDEDKTFRATPAEKPVSMPETTMPLDTFTEPVQKPARPPAEQPAKPIAPKTAMRTMREAKPSAPLFVKVDKYREALMNLQEIKSLLSGTKQLFTILNDIETIRTETLKLLRATLQRTERNVVELDSGLLRPSNLPEMPSSEHAIKTAHTEEALSDLQEQVNSLKKELKKFE